MSQTRGLTQWDVLPRLDGGADADEQAYVGFLGELGHGRVPRRRNGQRARVLYDLDSEIAQKDHHRDVRLVLSLHRQGLISRRTARRRLWELGEDVGGWRSWRRQGGVLATRVWFALRRLRVR